MKRFFVYHAVLAAVFLLFWTLLVVVEVKVAPFGFLRWGFLASLPLVFVSFLFASLRALQSRPRLLPVLATVSCAVFSPVFIFVGIVLVTNFKCLLGGRV